MTQCLIKDCSNPARKRGWCTMHYQRWQRHGDPLAVLRRGWRCGWEQKTTKRASVKPSTKDLHWAAGFIEGEGCFDKSNGSGRVSVNQVNQEPIDKLLALFGGAAKYYHKRRGTIHKSQPSPIWNWYASGSRARGIMLTLYSLMSAKRKEQIRNALS